MKAQRRHAGLMLLFILLAAWPARAAVSRLINFQGRVTDLSGTPIIVATTLVFRIYNASSGPSLLFTESQTVTPDADGLYSVNIGNITPLTGVDFSQDLWLSVEVNGEELTGRYQLTTSAYAVYASSAAVAPWSGLTGVPAGFSDGTDDTTPGSSTVGGTQIIDSTITASDLAADAVTSAKILNGEIVNADVSTSAELAPAKINGGSFQNEAYVFPAGATVGGSTITAGGSLQMPAGATITIGSVTGTVLPSGTMILTVSACPSGFTEYTAAQGLYLVGVPSGGAAAGTVGTPMGNLANDPHTHGLTFTTANNTTIALGASPRVATLTTPTDPATRGSIAPYIQVRLCTVP